MDQGKISEFQPFVRNYDLSPVGGLAFPQESVLDWDEFRLKLLKVMEIVSTKLATKDFEIHFVADAPLFDYPFHLITHTDGTALGDLFVVLLRYRDRLLYGTASVRKAWREYAEALRSMNPTEIKLLPLPATGDSRLIPEERGLCYLNFVISPSAAGGSAGTKQKRILAQLLRLGVPYLCWLHGSPAAEAWESELEKLLKASLEKNRTIERFPGEFTHQRTAGNPYAGHATLLWDDPQYNPFQTTTGMSLE